MSCLCIVMAFASGGLAVHYNKYNRQNALVVKKNALLFSGPDKGFQSLSQLACSDCVTVKETREGWYKVRYADMIGWVEADVVQII